MVNLSTMARHKFYLFLLFVILQMLLVFGFKGNKTLIEKKKLGETKELIFIGITSIAETAKGDLIIVDRYANRVKIVNKKGILIREFGKRGKEKGDFSKSPYLVVALKNGLAIVEFNSSKVLIFNEDSKFLYSFNVDGVIIDISVDTENNLWVGLLNMTDRKSKLACYNIHGKVLKIIELKNSYSRNDVFVNLFNFDISKLNKIVVAYTFINKIEIWDTDGHLVKEFKVEKFPDEAKKKLISINLFSKEFVPEGIIFSDAAIDADGQIYILGGSYSEKPGRDIYIFNTSGNFINKVILPDKASNIYLSSSGELLTIEKQNTVVGIYKLE